MITIQLKDDLQTQVQGRVFQYDDNTKILILKVWDPETQSYAGMAVYNAQNISLVTVHPLFDFEDIESEITHQFANSEDTYNRIITDMKIKFCKERVEERKAMLDRKYGARKQGIGGISSSLQYKAD